MTRLWLSLLLLSLQVYHSYTACTFTDTGLMYVGYKDKCLMRGPERFLKQYRSTENANVFNATTTYNCTICDPHLYLDCFNVDSDLSNEWGECDCIAGHSRGYRLIYDETGGLNQCRGYLNSSCTRSMPCHSDLVCSQELCTCKASGACEKIPKPRPIQVYDLSGTMPLFRKGSVFPHQLLLLFIVIASALKSPLQ